MPSELGYYLHFGKRRVREFFNRWIGIWCCLVGQLGFLAVCRKE